MEEIDNLVNALDRLGSPFLQVRRPGLSAEELRTEVRQHLPEQWDDYIDDPVIAWYGWQNGIDPDAAAAGGSAWQASRVITPDGLKLMGIHEVLTAAWEVTGFEHAQSLGIVFPLGPLDSSADETFLHKPTLNDEWTVCEHTFGEGLGGLESDGQFIRPPTFRDWLSALTEAINAGRLVLGQRGNITVPGEGIKRTTLHSYPWKG